jgi:hypothetical protein
MSEDYYIEIGRKRYQTLEAARLRTEATIAEHRANGYDEAAQEELGSLAHIVTEQQILENMRQQRVQQLTPQQPVEETPEQQRVKPMKDWRDAARVCGVTEEQYIKGFQEARNAGKLGEFRRSEDK